ncbi:MAG: SIS domain-containing protein [Ruminococcaceae bacterium]|jgi:glucosamine--fructose-6-phosphate aminotransferase (isomerizing)|nr:SIS domain-containing protein [Oscillospiraceae bacterium]
MINLEKEIREQPEALSRVLDLNLPVIREVVEKAKANGVKNVYFAARGTSDHACVYAQYLFGIFAGIPCTLGTPSVFTKYGAHVDLSGNLVVGVSQSGKAEDVLAVLESAKKDGAITVAVTNNTDSPMAKSADYHLFCGCGHEASIAATKTFTTQMTILGAMAAVWAGCDDLLDAFRALPAKAQEMLDAKYDDIMAFAEKYRNIPGAILLGRGISYCIALEGALKMLETNKLKMKGYPTSDFHHGPIAQVKPGDLVFVLSPKGATSGDSRDIIEKLLNVNADVVVLTDDASEAPAGTTPFVIPATGCEFTFPQIAVMFFQLLACCMTIVRGIDPDQAGVINKITITK